MKITTLDAIGIISYFVVVAIFAFFTRRTRTFSDFSVGSRKVPAAMIFASMAATYIGPGFSVGFTSKGFTSGYLFWFLALTYGVQTILMGLFFAPKLSEYRDCHTIGDVMDKKYGKFTHLLAGIVSVGLCIGFTAVMGKIGGLLLQSVSGWSLPVCIATVTMFTALYTFTGGVRAVIAADALQFSWFSILIPILLIVAFFKTPHAASVIADKATELTHSGFEGMNGMGLLGVAVSFLFGETLIPPYANRALAASSGTASKRGFVIAGLYCPLWLAIVITLGIFAHQFLPANTSPDDVFISLGKQLLPSGVFGLLLAAIIAIVMSSQESVLNSGTVSLVRDIIGFQKPLTDRSALITGRVGTLVLALIAVFVAGYSPSIIAGLLICYSIWAPAMLIPLLLALYLKKTKNMAGWLSILCGGITSFIWQTILKEPWGVPAILAGLAASGIGYAFGHFAGKPRTNIEIEGKI